MDILSELETIKADYSAANSLLEEAKASHDSLKAELADKDNAISAALELAAVKDKAIEGLNLSVAELQAQLADLTAKQKTAEEKAVEIVASQGIAPLKVDKAQADVLSKEEITAQLAAMKDPVARAEFYFANKAALFGK